MARQVHSVMQQPKDLDYLTALNTTDSKQYEMTAFTPTASDM